MRHWKVILALPLLMLIAPLLMGPSGGGGGSGGGGTGTNGSFPISGTNIVVTYTTNSGVISAKISLVDPVSLNTIIGTNNITPTNAIIDGTKIDFSKSEWGPLILTSNLTITDIINSTNGFYNQTIWKVKASGANRTIQVPWTISPNVIVAGSTITVTQNTWVDILHDAVPTVDTNSAVRAH
jgi:hypothetical protein